MKLYAYGDSWTEGQGCRLEDESNLKDRIILKDFRNKHSWPIKLANKLNCDHENNGWSGKANNLIFNEVIKSGEQDVVWQNKQAISQQNGQHRFGSTKESHYLQVWHLSFQFGWRCPNAYK